jgi:hypothetical protein
MPPLSGDIPILRDAGSVEIRVSESESEGKEYGKASVVGRHEVKSDAAVASRRFGAKDGFGEGVEMQSAATDGIREGEGGYLFEEIPNLVEATERPHMGEQHCGERRHQEVSTGP